MFNTASPTAHSFHGATETTLDSLTTDLQDHKAALLSKFEITTLYTWYVDELPTLNCPSNISVIPSSSPTSRSHHPSEKQWCRSCQRENKVVEYPNKTFAFTQEFLRKRLANLWVGTKLALTMWYNQHRQAAKNPSSICPSPCISPSIKQLHHGNTTPVIIIRQAFIIIQTEIPLRIDITMTSTGK